VSYNAVVAIHSLEQLFKLHVDKVCLFEADDFMQNRHLDWSSSVSMSWRCPDRSSSVSSYSGMSWRHLDWSSSVSMSWRCLDRSSSVSSCCVLSWRHLDQSSSDSSCSVLSWRCLDRSSSVSSYSGMSWRHLDRSSSDSSCSVLSWRCLDRSSTYMNIIFLQQMIYSDYFRISVCLLSASATVHINSL